MRAKEKVKAAKHSTAAAAAVSVEAWKWCEVWRGYHKQRRLKIIDILNNNFRPKKLNDAMLQTQLSSNWTDSNVAYAQRSAKHAHM